MPDVDTDFSGFVLQTALQAAQAPLLWPVLLMPSVVVLQDATWLGNNSSLLPAALNLLLLSNGVQVRQDPRWRGEGAGCAQRAHATRQPIALCHHDRGAVPCHTRHACAHPPSAQRAVNTSRHVPLPLSTRQSLWQSVQSLLQVRVC